LTERPEIKWRAARIDAVAASVIDRLAEMRGEKELPKPDNGLGQLKQCTVRQGSRMQNQRDQSMLNQIGVSDLRSTISCVTSGYSTMPSLRY
jgi:hypothetical protein